MEIIKFTVQGSAEEPYLVEFKKNNNNLTVLCNCPAGLNGMHCKHRIRILSGSSEGIISNNKKEIETILLWLKGTDVEKSIEELNQAEIELEKIKGKVASLKKKLSRSLND